MPSGSKGDLNPSGTPTQIQKMSSAAHPTHGSDANGAEGIGSSADLTEHAAALNDGRISSTQLVEQSLARIEASQATLNAFRVVCAKRARAEAVEADRRIAA